MSPKPSLAISTPTTTKTKHPVKVMCYHNEPCGSKEQNKRTEHLPIITKQTTSCEIFLIRILMENEPTT